MTEPDGERLARIETKLDSLIQRDDTAERRLDAHSARLDKLERIAYVALGIAIASGVPQVAAAFG